MLTLIIRQKYFLSLKLRNLLNNRIIQKLPRLHERHYESYVGARMILRGKVRSSKLRNVLSLIIFKTTHT